MLRQDIVARLVVEGCQSLEEQELKRCFQECVSPECCLAHVNRAKAKGYTYGNFVVDSEVKRND